MIAANVVVVGAIAAAVLILKLLAIHAICRLTNRMRKQKQYV